MKRAFLITLLLLVGACTTDETRPQDTIATTCVLPTDGSPTPHTGSWAPQPDTVDGLSRLAKVDGTDLLLQTVGSDAAFVVGVNLGATVPNHAPGELALDREDYRRWFPQMAAMGFRAVRIYTIHPPEFYEELVAYNTANPDAPLYVIHGVWIPEEDFVKGQDLHAASVVADMRAEIDDSIGAVTGTITIPDQPGHASGSYTADITPWLYSWAIGVEWDPTATLASDEKNRGMKPQTGQYFASLEGASPTEIWIAGMLDHLATGLAERGLTMPLSFVNWPTADPLAHPDEPIALEDKVGVDANFVAATNAWPGGFYASYHAYPYYPDFVRYQPGIADCQFRGGADPYAGYLIALRVHHAGMPVVVNEFGVPSAAGSAHFGPKGRDQGDHSEQEMMAMNADMLDMLYELGFSGGYVFEWVDEWFKFTWNTIDFELPRSRRSLWMNPWTNEAHFGMVAVEPGLAPPVIIDGDDEEWKQNGSQVILESSTGVRQVRALKDEGYLYLRLFVDGAYAWDADPVTIGFDVLPGGTDGLPARPDAPDGSDYAITLGPGAEAQVWLRASNDQFAVRYGVNLKYVEVDKADVAEGSGVWNKYRLIINRPQTIPTTGQKFLAEIFEAGALRYGTSDPTDPAFDSRTMWADSANVIELRIPFQAIGIADPSSLQAYRIEPDGAVTTEEFDRIGIVVAFGDRYLETSGYSWDPWQAAESHERIKVGVEVFTEAANRIHGENFGN